MQNMRNTQSPKTQLERGKTYVSFGFVDLQQLMEAEVTGPEENGPIAWCGLDMNPMAVARAKLITVMLVGGVPGIQILQIWFSSNISSEALKSLSFFCGKLEALEEDDDVRHLFLWWKKASLRPWRPWNFEHVGSYFIPWL